MEVAQEENQKNSPEEPVLFLRRHWLVFLPSLFVHLFLILIFWVICFVVYSFIPSAFQELTRQGIVIIGSCFMLIEFLLLLISWVNYYFDIAILTSSRFIQLTQVSIFNRTISEMPLTRVQDVRVEVKGILKTYLGYGDIHIETAGDAPNFLLKDIPSPYVVADKIIAFYQKAAQESLSRPEVET